MSRCADYSGEVIGSLTCVKKTDEKTPSGSYKYLYKCCCGEERVAARGNLMKTVKKGWNVSCGCMTTTRAKDITGVKSYKLTAIESTGNKSSNGDYIWKCKCDCGNYTEIPIGAFNSGHTKSCGCAAKEVLKLRSNYHGLEHTKVYRSWCKIKRRCFNEDDKSYSDYGAKGISMDDEYRNNFLAFFEEVGHSPVNSPDYSIDRIDNTKGYVKGNMRWTSRFGQARNKGLSSNNTTGIKGVHIDKKKCKSVDRFYAKAAWSDLEGKRRSKAFSFDKYGSELALFLAQEYRTTMMERLNLLGAGYTHYHIYGEPEND